MDPLGEAQIRASFVNCSKGEAKRARLPRELDRTPWADLDFLGWRDPGAPDRAYLVTGGPQPVGVTLRAAGTGGAPPGFAGGAPTQAKRGGKNLMRTSLCSICLTGHSGGGVDLLAAPRAGEAGRQGNTVGIYMCADLACSLYVRGRKTSVLAKRMEETLTLQEQVERTVRNLEGFLARVTAAV